LFIVIAFICGACNGSRAKTQHTRSSDYVVDTDADATSSIHGKSGNYLWAVRGRVADGQACQTFDLLPGSQKLDLDIPFDSCTALTAHVTRVHTVFGVNLFDDGFLLGAVTDPDVVSMTVYFAKAAPLLVLPTNSGMVVVVVR
jgi:hypothetical protein